MAGERSLFKRLDDPAEAVSRLAGLLGMGPLERLLASAVRVGVDELQGRVVAEDVKAPRSLPWYPRSIVDGCAVRSVDVAGAFEDRPVRLRRLGRVRIGVKPSLRVEAGSCVEVDTGSWVPLGADAVVPVEYVSDAGGGYVLVERGARPGGGIAAPASDVAEGDLIVKRGTPWSPRLTPALAALGLRSVLASRRPVAAVASVGDELVEAGGEPGEAGIFDSNRPLLKASLAAMGWEVVDLGIVGDDEAELAEALSRARDAGADLIVTSGGTSAGLEDVVYRVVGRLGRLVAHGLRIKPGKPTILAEVSGVPFVGLPGNPRSAANVFERVLVPLLDKLGLPTWPYTPRGRVEARTASLLAGERGRDTIVPVALASGEPPAAIPVARDSYMISSYAWSDGEVVVPAGLHKPIEPGSTVEVETYGAPRRRLIVAADPFDPSQLVESLGLHGAVHAPTANMADLLAALPPGSLVVASTIGLPGGGPWRVKAELAERDVVVAGSGRCARAAVPAVYAPLASKARAGVPAPVPRTVGAAVLLGQGYVDCAILPEDLARGLGVPHERVAREKLILLEATGTQRGGEESAGSKPENPG